MKNLKLNSGFEMPIMGFGTWQIKDADVFYRALKNGYRNFDTATVYGNEEMLGEALERGIQEGIATRENIFIATKLWHSDYADPEAALRLSLSKLKTDYVDLYLIHWPNNGVGGGVLTLPMYALWKKMEELVKKGLAKSIGVSNFNIQLLADMLTYVEIKPAVNQV